MNKIIVFLSLLFLITVIILPPVYLQADNFRASNSPTFTGGKTVPPINQQVTAEDIRDIIGPVKMPEPVPYLLYGLAALLAVLFVLLAIFMVNRKKNKPIELPDPAETALTALADAERRIKETGSTVFASKISDILRSYIEQTFSIPSTRQTTIEFFNRLKSQQTTNGRTDISTHRDTLEKCLSLCDLAKYAHFLPKNDVVLSLSGHVREFITSTRKQEAKD